MSNYRYLIFNTIIGSLFVSAIIICQPPQSAQEAHVYTGSRSNLPQQDEQPSQHAYVGRQDAKTSAKVITVAQPTEQPVRTYTENRSGPTQPAVKVARSSPTPSTPNQHAYQPNRQQNNRTTVAAPQPAVQITPPQSKRPLQAHVYDNRLPAVAVNVAPARQRPIIIQRPLPQTIVINQRSAVCPFATLVPVAVAKKGNFVELNDGSIWKVRHRDRNKVKKWTSNDAIVIETGNFFSWHSYSLVNYSRGGESIDVELHISDNWNGSASHWIVEVNPFQGYVRLENGSIWRMSTSELASWSQNDDVIIGLSKDWFSSRYNYVLINPRAKSRFTATLEF